MGGSVDGVRTIEQHRDLLTAMVRAAGYPQRLRVERLAVSAAGVAADPHRVLHRVLAEPVVALRSLPAADNSQMDGYAVRASDLATASADTPVTLRTVGRIVAGDAPTRTLGAGEAVAIMTGALMPAGADAVVPVERVDPPRFHEHEPGASDVAAPAPQVRFTTAPAPGEYVRRAGSDITAGSELLPAGAVLGPAQIGALAGNGVVEVAARMRPRVLVVATGAEVRPPGTMLRPGQLHDANTASLAAALTAIGADVTPVLCPSDEPADLIRILQRHARDADLLVTVGAASRGAREVVRDVLEPAGVEFAEIAMQPGGPQGFGAARIPGRDATLPTVSLPGNPVSALVSFEVLLRALLTAMTGAPDPAITGPWPAAPLAGATRTPPGKDQLRRGRIAPDGTLHFEGGQQSHLVTAMARASVLIRLRHTIGGYAAGDPAEYWHITD